MKEREFILFFSFLLFSVTFIIERESRMIRRILSKISRIQTRSLTKWISSFERNDRRVAVYEIVARQKSNGSRLLFVSRVKWIRKINIIITVNWWLPLKTERKRERRGGGGADREAPDHDPNELKSMYHDAIHSYFQESKTDCRKNVRTCLYSSILSLPLRSSRNSITFRLES